MTGFLYFLSRLDSLHGLFTACITFSTVVLIVFTLARYLTFREDAGDNYERYQLSYRRARRASLAILVVSTLLKIATPNTRDAYIIFGAGETLEYLKENDTARKLPDKAIQALDAWMDTMISDSTKQEEQR